MRALFSAIGEVKARFAEHVRRAEKGETIVLTRHGRPVARLAPLDYRTGPDGEVREPERSYQDGRHFAPTGESRREALERLLEEEVWPRVPADQQGRRVEKREREEILGYESEGL